MPGVTKGVPVDPWGFIDNLLGVHGNIEVWNIEVDDESPLDRKSLSSKKYSSDKKSTSNKKSPLDEKSSSFEEIPSE